MCPSSTCAIRFCFRCRDEIADHAPARCDQMEQWRKKANDGDLLNQIWTRDNTKSCPNCFTVIEKGQGCMHMTCSGVNPPGCRFEFCWICLSKWSVEHACNKYVRKKKDICGESLDNSEDLERFTHYFDRFNAQATSEGFAVKSRLLFKERVAASRETSTDIGNLMKAVYLVVRARQFLKMSYVYGYYSYREAKVKPSSRGKGAVAAAGGGGGGVESKNDFEPHRLINQDLFENYQHTLETNTEILHGMLEKDTFVMLSILNQSTITENFLEKIIETLQE
ncbi:unannotated protein [freshwater metagenome]|uniref:Unannotated protein n=1 Tax=freshwater metagenome TaxID=449393 RepID=A0A6J7IEP3_9ZZZZ